MSNLRYLNQQNPWMDMISSFSRLGGEHPFAAFNPEARGRGPPPGYDGPQPETQEEKTPPSSDEDPPAVPPPEDGPPHRGPSHHQGRHHPGPHAFGGRCGGRGGWGGRGRRGWARHGFGGPGFGGGFDMNRLADFIGQFSPEAAAEVRSREAAGAGNTGGKDFAPDADIFDTEDGFVVHVSLPGAKKEDVGVNWDADKSELNIAGVIHRPGDEAFLKTLALDERKVGVFERGIKLGSKENPAQVDSDGISAKMEDGILIVTIPKVEKDFVEVKKVDIN